MNDSFRLKNIANYLMLYQKDGTRLLTLSLLFNDKYGLTIRPCDDKNSQHNKEQMLVEC